MSFKLTLLASAALLLVFGCENRRAPSPKAALPEQVPRQVEPPATAVADREAIDKVAAQTVSLNCSSELTEVKSHLETVRVVKDQVGNLRMAFNHSKAALEVCADAEILWYALIRGGELRAGRFPVTIGSQSFGSVLEAAQHAADLHPKSTRIWTVRARSLGTEEAARAAVALDEAYVPAAIALAEALIKTGKAQEALPILDRPRVSSAPGVHLTRSRALLSLGQTRRAVASAKRERTAGNMDSPEPFLSSDLWRDTEEALGLALHADHQETLAHAHLVSAAEMGSKNAQALLRPDEWRH